MDVDVARNSVKVRDSEVILDMLPVTIGRGAEASIQVRDRWASRLNCEIGEVDGTLFVRDLESRNGTLVNGEHVTESVLHFGDHLTIGTSTFVVSRCGQTPLLSLITPDVVNRDNVLDDCWRTTQALQRYPE